MIRHNILLFFRNIKKHRNTFLINIIGLSIGLASVLLITLWVTDELSIDGFHENDRALYQVLKNNIHDNGIETGEDTPGPLAQALVNEIPEVERAVSVFPPEDYTFEGMLSLNNSNYKAQSKFAGRDFFKLFSYPLILGNKETVLTDKTSFLISSEMAKKLFPDTEDVIGKIVEWKGERINGSFSVGGIFRSPPSNSSIQFDVLFSFNLLTDKSDSFRQWNSSGPSTYVMLKKDADVANFNTKIKDFVKGKDKASTIELFARPYSDRYLYGKFENGKVVGGRITYVKVFILIALFILVIACINFVNLSTARASRRFKEVGMKKVMGAGRNTLIYQYLGESGLTVFFSMLLALVLVALSLAKFGQITGKEFSFQFNFTFLLVTTIIMLVTGLLAGAYPAFYLSRFEPITILKGTKNQSSNKAWSDVTIRKALVVFQFTASVVLITAVLVVYQQIDYIQSKNLGFAKENVLTIPAVGKLAEDTGAFIKELGKTPGVINASYMYGDLTELHGGTSALDWAGKQPDQTLDFEFIGAGIGLVETLGMEMLSGRSFSKEFQTEDSKIIFNETAIKTMGLENPIGKTVNLFGEPKEIIGVVKDFHFESFYENVKPFFFRIMPKAKNIVVKINGGSIGETLGQIEEVYGRFNKGIPFDYKFLNDDFQKLYVSEQRVATLSKYFAALAVIISCLGLFGLAAFTAERRRKEIGIRKVLGQSAMGITLMLSKEFTRLVLISILIALPIAYWLTKDWLSDFAYRISLSLWYFAVAGILAFLVSMFTVGSQAIKAANLNPVEGLREE